MAGYKEELPRNITEIIPKFLKYFGIVSYTVNENFKKILEEIRENVEIILKKLWRNIRATTYIIIL